MTDETFDPLNPAQHVYSRYTQDSSSRAEKILSKVNVSSCSFLTLAYYITLAILSQQDGYALTYASGIAAVYAVGRPARIVRSTRY